MNVTILTLFPEFFDSPLSAGLMAKARERGILSVTCVNPRDFAMDRHHTVDDGPYGGGPGMVMRPEPVVAALESVGRPGRVLQLSPRGAPLTQELARELSAEESLTVVCGRYEGIDARLSEVFPVTDVSVGDFVLSGGESAAVCLLEAVGRLLPGFMGKEASGEEESFSAGLLEYPHYTRPEEFRGLRVPEALLSGDHARIRRWRRDEALKVTLSRRPGLLDEAVLDRKDLATLAGVERARLGRNLYIALVHHPVLDKWQKVSTVSLTNLDVHDISRSSRTYGGAGLFVVTPLADQRELAATLLAHWTSGQGAAANPDRAKALSLVRIVEDLEAATAAVQAETGRSPFVVATSARPEGTASPAMVRAQLAKGPVLLVLGTGHGLAAPVLKRADATIRPIRCLDDYNHLSVRSAASILLDRLLGDWL
jgi:tRNA (guanine37-N1)-methyltransferase